MPQSLNGSDSDHLALLHFPDQDAAESFLAREEGRVLRILVTPSEIEGQPRWFVFLFKVN